MYATPKSPHPLRLPESFTHWMVGLFMAVLLALVGMAAHAAAPAAGASISNQASASYQDGSKEADGTTLARRTVLSNLVSTTVTQVASVTLDNTGAQTATPGSIVYYTHVLTNTGNGADTFALSGSLNTAGNFAMTSVVFYADDGSGRPTGVPITSTGSLAAGATFKLIAAATLPNTVTAGQTNTIRVTGTSTFSGTATAYRDDVTTVTTNAVVTLSKGIDISTGVSPASAGVQVPYTYTLAYTNTGNSTAENVTISDEIPVGMTFVSGSARWSVTGATPLSNTTTAVTAGTSPNTLTSLYGATGALTTFKVVLLKLAPGQSGTISFQVKLNVGVAPGVLNNTANLSYDNGAVPVTAANIISGSSNTVPFTVTQTTAVGLTSATVAGPAAAGSTVTFTNVVTNNGSHIDSFNIKLEPLLATDPLAFPPGTTFQLFKSDGTTPLVDTGVDGIVDTGPLAPGGTYNVIVKATLPPNAPTKAADSVMPVRATSVFDSGVTTPATDTLSAITGASVDLTNSGATNPDLPGTGTGPEVLAQKTNSVNPGSTTTFVLDVKNTGLLPDSFDLASSSASNFGSALPLGWAVTFKADGGGNCSTTGATITNTGSVAAAASTKVCAVVTVPAGYAAGTYPLYFRTLSPISGVQDILHDAVTVNAVRSITLTPNGTGQTYPGGSYLYTHTLTNNGNVTEATAATSDVVPSVANSKAGWTSNLYYDKNGDGVLDSSDPLITTGPTGTLNALLAANGILGLVPGQSIKVFDKVISPSGALAGDVNASTITVTTTNGSGYTTTVPAPTVAADTTTVITGNLILEKKQLVDTTCLVTPAPATGYVSGNLSAKPGDCVLYQITVTNVGAVNATSVIVSDVTPSYTTLSLLPAVTVGAIEPTGLALLGTGTIKANVGTGATTAVGGGGTLAPGESAVLTFGVRLNP
jgi:uncharacterized repeat protein (TIGR01451 family)